MAGRIISTSLPLDMGSHQVNRGADATLGKDLVTLDQLLAGIAAIALAVPDTAIPFGQPSGLLPISDVGNLAFVNASNTVKIGANDGGGLLLNVNAAPNADTVMHLSSKGSGANQGMYFAGGGGPQIPNAGDHLFFSFGPAFNQDVASNADPHYLTMALFQRPTYNAVGIGGGADSSLLGDRAAATVAIGGPPILTGNWGTGSTGNLLSFWVQSGNARVSNGDLIVGNLTGTEVMRAGASASPGGLMSFWGGPGQTTKPTVSGTRADGAALASVLSIGATYGLWFDTSTAGTSTAPLNIAEGAIVFGPPGGGIPIGDAPNLFYNNATNAVTIGGTNGGSLDVNGNVTANTLFLSHANPDALIGKVGSILFLEAKGTEVFQDSQSGSIVGPALLVQAGSHSSVPAGADQRQVQFNLGSLSWLGGSDVAAWRAMHLFPPTIGFTSPRSFGTVATLAIGGAPALGSNVVAVNSRNALWVESGQVRIDGPLVTNVSAPGAGEDAFVWLQSPGGGGNQGMFFVAGGGPQVQNGADHRSFTFGAAFNQDVASNADPHYLTMAFFNQMAYNAVGIGGADSSLLGDRAAATVAIGGPPILTGNWGTGSTGNLLSFWVQRGNVRLSRGDLNVGNLLQGPIFHAGADTTGGASGSIGFWGETVGQTSRPTITGAKGGNAALASLIFAGVVYGLWNDGTSA